LINNDYQSKIYNAKKLKDSFERKAIKEFKASPTAKTSLNLLLDYYNLVKQ
jgi:hypothetical protein